MRNKINPNQEDIEVASSVLTSEARSKIHAPSPVGAVARASPVANAVIRKKSAESVISQYRINLFSGF